jgi:protein-tyrosine phosphatase
VPNPRLVLFLCSGNYYRSRYAELYFLSRVPEEAGWTAISRGFRLSPSNVGPIAVAALERLRALGVDPPEVIRPPRELTPEDVRRADRIIALDEDEHRPMVERYIPDAAGRVTYWHVPDVEFMPAGEALSLIERRVEELIRSLVSVNPPSTE